MPTALPLRPPQEPAAKHSEELPGRPGNLRLTEPGFALALQATTLTHSRCKPAAVAFVTELARACACSRVAVGFVQHSDIQLAAVSHGADEEPVGPVFDLVAAAMEEALEQRATVVVPAAPDTASVIRIAHMRLLQRVGGAVASIPLIYQGEAVAVFSFEWETPPPAVSAVVRFLESLLSLTGPVLYLLRQREIPLRSQVARAASRLAAKLRAPDGQKLRLALGGAVVAIVGLLAVPVPYRVGGHARIEGAIQRSIVAPMDGYLKSVAVRPGDHVSRGQTLFDLDDQDLALQRRKWASELAQQENTYASATASLDRSKMVIALARAQQARAQLDLVDSDMARVRVTAPFDGVVMQGDLSRSLGAPVERGTEMMVLAPAQSVRAVIEVDERDIGRLRVGQRGVLSLSALPWDSSAITVTRITPVAHTVEGSNVFDAEAEISGNVTRIRPGLAGVAKIVVSHRPLIWIWDHRLFDWLHQSLWSWLP
jgi:multidrug resistance efflux pump